jgi:hypothetical protein
MASLDEQILRAAKEIVVKFIEVGRLSPAGFPDTFKIVYQTVEKLAKKSVHLRPEIPSPPAEMIQKDSKSKKKKK